MVRPTAGARTPLRVLPLALVVAYVLLGSIYVFSELQAARHDVAKARNELREVSVQSANARAAAERQTAQEVQKARNEIKAIRGELERGLAGRRSDAAAPPRARRGVVVARTAEPKRVWPAAPAGNAPRASADAAPPPSAAAPPPASAAAPRPAASGSRHLVMAAAAGQPYMRGAFSSFVDTMRHVAKYSGDCVLFVVKDCNAFMDPSVLPWLERERVELVYKTTLPCSWSPKEPCVDDPVWGPRTPVALARYRWYLETARRADYDLILWQDFRDAFWQRDPFPDFAADSKGKDLLWFGEHPARLVTANSFTKIWVEACWGKGLLDHVPADSPVICSGSGMGTGKAIVAYLTEYLAAIEKQYASTKNDACVAVKYRGMDQGHHNHQVYSLLDPSRFTVAAYDQGPVYTAGQAAKLAPSDLKRDAEGFVVRGDGRRAGVVHQFDRSDALLKQKDKVLERVGIKARLERGET